jgi:hypothetical protein
MIFIGLLAATNITKEQKLKKIELATKLENFRGVVNQQSW